MAIIQGMCRNCGSLIMFDDRDGQCECVFCHCVFPSSEAVEIFNNPEGRTFPNERYEVPEGNSKHNATRVFSAESLEKQIARDELRRANSEERRDNEFEVQAKDVKAPKKLVIGLWAGFAAVVALILAISFPLYKSRTALREDIEASIDSVFDGVVTVDTTTDAEEKFYNGFSVFGQKCQYMNAITTESLTEQDAIDVYNNYCVLRAEKIGDGSSDIYSGVKVKLYCAGGYYTVTGEQEAVNVVFTEDEGTEG